MSGGRRTPQTRTDPTHLDTLAFLLKTRLLADGSILFNCHHFEKVGAFFSVTSSPNSPHVSWLFDAPDGVPEASILPRGRRPGRRRFEARGSGGVCGGSGGFGKVLGRRDQFRPFGVEM